MIPIGLFLLAFSYLLGSIPFGLLLTRLAGLGDIRRVGSGNIGATNVLRTGRKGLAATTLLLDGAKGFAPAALSATLFPQAPLLPWLCGLAAVLGHVFPPWLGFRGGKGVATGIGALLGAAPPVGELAALVWLVVALLFRISSLAALSAFALAPLLAYALVSGPAAGLALVLAALVYFRHTDNIRRLIAGTEPRFSLRRPPRP